MPSISPIFSVLVLSTLALTTPIEAEDGTNAAALAAAACPNTLTSNFNGTGNLDADPNEHKIIRCGDRVPGASNSPQINRWNCYDAVYKLRNINHDVGYFHYGAPEDQWSLPAWTETGDCRAAVELINTTATEPATWSDIKRDMCEIIHDCSLGLQDWLTTGGWTTHGPNNGLKISIRKASRNSASGDHGVQTV